jgi:shikimate kinase
VPEATRHREASGVHIVLLGMMGSGKTTIGTRLAARIERPFIDSDDVLRSTAGRDAARIAREDGVEALHAAEAELLLDILRGNRPAVIAAAASAVESEPCRRALAHHTCIWFDADPATLASRQHRADHRRTLPNAGDGLAALKPHRDPFYDALALVRIDTAATDPDEALLAALEATERPELDSP